MAGRGKSKQARSKGLSQRLKKDRINELPDPLICQILSQLSTKEAVSTSVLSTRWRNLWLWVPNMELNSRKFQDINAFVSFGDRFFDPIRVSSIHKLILTLGKKASTLDDESYFTSWIEAAIKRKIQHLDVRWSKEIYLSKNPLRLYSCETLVYLRLYDVILDDDVFVVLPCLKTMYLDRNWYPSEAALKKLISSCPVLESLKIVASDIDTKVFRVHSLSLKTLTIERGHIILPQYDNVPGVVIDAPLLRRLSIDDSISESFVVNNMASNAKLDVSLSFGLCGYTVQKRVPSMRSSIRDFLLGISRVRKMAICSRTFKIICRYSELEPLPQFCCMSRLCVTIHAIHLKLLETFLESCPNLKSLILEHIRGLDYTYELPSEEMNQTSLSSLPQCLLSSLELVDLEVPISGLAAEMKLVKYFLKNSAILKKLILSLGSCSKKDEILKEIFEFPRGSSECELVVE